MSDVPESNSRTADRRFAQGNPGGPGRPRKVVKAAADALDERVAQAAGDPFEVALSLANERNITAVKMLLDRVWPVGRNRPLEVAMPEMPDTADMLAASTAVTYAVLAGEATGQEGVAFAQLLKAHKKVVNRHDLAAYLRQFNDDGTLREAEGDGEK